MTTGTRPIDRRSFLRAVGVAGVGASLAGCTAVDSLGADEGDDGLVLPPPENHDRLAESDLPHPIYGEELPEATVPAPLRDRSVTTTEFVGERHTMLTFVFTSCTTVCPGLTSSLRRVQADSIDEGYADEMAFQVLTFDPEYDTGEVLRSYGEDLGVNFDVGNWYFLRPETPADAREIVEGRFGVAFERDDGGDPDSDDGEAKDHEEDDRGEMDHGDGDEGEMDHGDGDEGEMDHDDGEGGDGMDHEGGEGMDEGEGGEGMDHDENETEDDDHGGHGRHFVHSSLILLVNEDGLVERAHTGGPPNPGTIVDEARTLVEGW